MFAYTKAFAIAYTPTRITSSALFPAVCCGVRHRLLTSPIVIGFDFTGASTSNARRPNEGVRMLPRSKGESSPSSTGGGEGARDMRRVLI